MSNGRIVYERRFCAEGQTGFYRGWKPLLQTGKSSLPLLYKRRELKIKTGFPVGAGNDK
jgi:hypothetical protein